MPATVLAPKDALSWHLPATPLVHCRRHAYVGALLIAGTLGYMAPQLPRRDREETAMVTLGLLPAQISI